MSDIIFRYKAFIGQEVERAEVRWEAPSQQYRGVLSSAPAWSPRSWPSQSEATEVSDLEFALRKIATMLEFGSEIDANAGELIRHALRAKFPQMATLRGTGRIEAEAVVSSDGEASFSFKTPGQSSDIPLSNSPRGERRADLTLFVQNALRADIYDRLAAVH
jgi:hypothetical protein